MSIRITGAKLSGTLLGAFCLLFSVLASGSAQGAEIVDVRIGVHPEYTRMVFELDRPADYKVLRGSGRQEVLIALDADSIPRRLKSEKSLVSQVEIVPTATGSEARVSLAREGLSLKEMILADPPRIVLDIIGKKVSAVQPAAAKKSAARKAPAQPKKQAKSSKPAAKPKVAQKPAPKSPAKPAKVITANSRPSKPVIRVDAPPKQSPPAQRKKSTPSVAQAGKKEATPAKVSAPGAKPVAAAPAGGSEEVEADAMTASAKQIFAVAGLVVVLVAWRLVRRRRGSGPASAEADGAELASVTPNPFAVLEPPGAEEAESMASGVEAEPDLAAAVDQAMAGESGEDEADSEQALFDELPLGAALSEEADQASEFDLSEGPEIMEPASLADSSDEDETVEAAADTTAPVELQEQAPEAGAETAGSDPYEAGRAAGREVAEEALLLVRGLEDRIAGLQSQLEVALESRERIERQMAAQNEELRVQRAAIARTQRAVRNISRPEEDGHGESAAPPAD